MNTRHELGCMVALGMVICLVFTLGILFCIGAAVFVVMRAVMPMT